MINIFSSRAGSNGWTATIQWTILWKKIPQKNIVCGHLSIPRTQSVTCRFPKTNRLISFQPEVPIWFCHYESYSFNLRFFYVQRARERSATFLSVFGECIFYAFLDISEEGLVHCDLNIWKSAIHICRSVYFF